MILDLQTDRREVSWKFSINTCTTTGLLKNVSWIAVFLLLRKTVTPAELCPAILKSPWETQPPESLCFLLSSSHMVTWQDHKADW